MRCTEQLRGAGRPDSPVSLQAGLLLAETEFVMQVESDIAPFKDLLMGLFFMTVGMEISFGLFISKFRLVMGALVLLIVGKVALMVAVGQAFGLSRVQSARAGLLLAAGGEFAFVALCVPLLCSPFVSPGTFPAAWN